MSEKGVVMSFVIQNLQLYICDNGQGEIYTATLKEKGGNRSLQVSLSKPGDTFVAYENTTDMMYDLIVDPSKKNISDLRNGDEINMSPVNKPSI